MAFYFSCISGYASLSYSWFCLFLSKFRLQKSTSTKTGVAPDSTNMNKGREGVKNPENFADVLYGWPLIMKSEMKCVTLFWRISSVKFTIAQAWCARNYLTPDRSHGKLHIEYITLKSYKVYVCTCTVYDGSNSTWFTLFLIILSLVAPFSREIYLRILQ